MQFDAIPRCSRSGFSLIEVMITLGIIGIMAAAATPSMRSWRDTAAGRSAARSIAGAFELARGQAIQTGHNHMVFFSSGTGVDAAPAGRDAASNPLVDSSGAAVPILVLDDGAPNDPDQDCDIDAAELRTTFAAESGVVWGPTQAGSASTAPEDDGATIPDNGLTFVDPTGGAVTWVLFRPDGIPVSVDAACTQGRVGTGGGTVYISNAERDFAVTLSPLGAVRIHTWTPTSGTWTQ